MGRLGVCVRRTGGRLSMDEVFVGRLLLCCPSSGELPGLCKSDIDTSEEVDV
jgi:hypothetical protein